MKHLIASNLQQTLVQQLEKAILERTYKPGERLPPEREFADKLGVSRSTLREAIGQLVTAGMLVRRHGDGTYVTDQIDARMSDPWTDLLKRHPLLQGDLLEFRKMLEAETATLAAQRANAADKEHLQKLFDRMDKAYQSNDRKIQVKTDVAFHRGIADATHNPVFSYLMGSLMTLLHEHVHISISDVLPDSETARQLMRQHRVILDAIIDGDTSRARKAASTHLIYIAQRLNDEERLSTRRKRNPN